MEVLTIKVCEIWEQSLVSQGLFLLSQVWENNQLVLSHHCANEEDANEEINSVVSDFVSKNICNPNGFRVETVGRNWEPKKVENIGAGFDWKQGIEENFPGC